MMSIQRLRTFVCELAGEAWDCERCHLAAQAQIRHIVARVLMTQADTIQREMRCSKVCGPSATDPTNSVGSRTALAVERAPRRSRATTA